jgi:hypothetical protein
MKFSGKDYDESLVGQGEFPEEEILWMRFDSLLLCFDVGLVG